MREWVWILGGGNEMTKTRLVVTGKRRSSEPTSVNLPLGLESSAPEV